MATKKTTATAAKVETKVEAKKATEVKVEAPKATEVKVEAPKAAEVKAEAPKTAEVKAEAPAKEAKKAPAKKAATKTTEKKAPAKKAATKTTTKKEVAPVVLVQFGGQEVSMDTVIANAKNAYEAAGNKVSSIKEIQIYVKPEEYAAYYVINGVTGRINLF